jgi:hypothetical protein
MICKDRHYEMSNTVPDQGGFTLDFLIWLNLPPFRLKFRSLRPEN